MQAANFYLAKVCLDMLACKNIPIHCHIKSNLSCLVQAWFHSSQPMTRSRSSELRYIILYFLQKQKHEAFLDHLNYSYY